MGSNADSGLKENLKGKKIEISLVKVSMSNTNTMKVNTNQFAWAHNQERYSVNNNAQHTALTEQVKD